MNRNELEKLLYGALAEFYAKQDMEITEEVDFLLRAMAEFQAVALSNHLT